MLSGYDLDGVLTAGVVPQEPYVVISGRTWGEWDPSVSWHVPVAIRGAGAYGDRQAAGRFKATMINLWRVERYYEDDPLQAAIIRSLCPDCEVVEVPSAVSASA